MYFITIYIYMFKVCTNTYKFTITLSFIHVNLVIKSKPVDNPTLT